MGTGRQNDLVLREQGVSFKHAALHLRADGHLELEPEESRGGTWSGDQLLAADRRHVLRVGDRFRLGTVELEVAVPPPPRLLRLELGLEVLRGRQSGELFPLGPGTSLLGSARQASVCLREPGISFKHAALRLDEQGLGELEDVGSKEGTWLNGERLEPHAPRPLKPWDGIQLGPQVALLLVPRLVPAGPTPLLDLLPEGLRGDLPAEVLGLAGEPGRGRPLPPVLDALGEQAGAREDLERDARQMLVELQHLLHPEHLPPHPELWLRQDPETSELGFYHEDGRGFALAWRRWELVARLPSRVPGLGPSLVGRALARLFRGAARLVAAEFAAPCPGWGWCRYRSSHAILGAFERIDAWSDGGVLAAVMRPHFKVRPFEPDRGEDPITELVRQQAARRLWRPPAQGVGPAAPALPPGGREGRRPLPRRRRS